MSNYPEELHSLFQVRDALQLLCDKGYDLHAMLDQCEIDIKALVEQRRGL